MSLELVSQSPEDRARRYQAKADEARQALRHAHDPLMRASIEKLVADWEYLARHVVQRRI